MCDFPAAADLDRRIRELRAERADLERQLRQVEHELTLCLIAADRRPPDGSDQPALFEADNPKLF